VKRNAVVVLNTRSAGQAAELSRLLVAAGFDVIEAPAIAIVPAWDAAELRRVRLELRSGAYAWVVLPGQNAAGGLESELATARVVCGASTAKALGVEPALALRRFSAAAAVDLLQTYVAAGERVLVPHAAEGRDELEAGLRRLGAHVDAPVAYRTMLADAAAVTLRSEQVDVLTLCSPSSVRAIATAVSSETLVVCLGQTTADAAHEAGLRVDAIATATTMTALVNAVASLVNPGVGVGV
jgi:uroporphyrinogen-III synthase